MRNTGPNAKQKLQFCAFRGDRVLELAEFTEFLNSTSCTAQESELKAYYSQHESPETILKFIVERDQLILVINDEALSVDLQVSLRKKREINRREGAHNQLLYKALGLAKSKSQGAWIYDATAGLGEDLCSFLSFGLNVTCVERNPLLYCLLANALQRLGPISGQEIQLELGEACERLSDKDYYAIYFDPFFQKKKKKAKAKRSMELVSTIFKNDDIDSTEVAAHLLSKCSSRLIIKRSDKAPKLIEKPTYEIKGKTIRFDIYYRG